MKIQYHPRKKTYAFEEISETGLQIFYQAFMSGRPFEDIPGLQWDVQHIAGQLAVEQDKLVAREERGSKHENLHDGQPNQLGQLLVQAGRLPGR